MIWEWTTYKNIRFSHSLIIAPTRELARQISTVLTDVSTQFREYDFRIEIVTIVGGMSEHKQRRQLCGLTRPTHIVVATPGRLSQLLQDEEILAFQDMSGLRFLVVDEADRIMEDGHYAEVNCI